MVESGSSLLGTVVDGRDVYEVRQGTAGGPVTLWLARFRDPVGSVSGKELGLARDGLTPNVDLHGLRIADLNVRHFWLRKAVGMLIRKPDPNGSIDIQELMSS